MTVELTAATLAAALDERSGDAWPVLCEFTHPAISQVLRLANNAVDVTFAGNTYIGARFAITLPADDGRSPRAEITFASVTERFIRSMRAVHGLGSHVEATFIKLRSGDLTRAIATYAGYRLINVRTGETSVTGELIMETFDTTPCPGRRASKEIAPALWRA